MSDPRPAPKRRRRAPILALALLAGAAAGAAGVYVMGSRPGNESAAACPADETLRAALDGASRGEVAAMVALDAPFDASRLAFRDERGAQTTIAAMRGQALLVNLWATWCAPCRAEMPALDELERVAGDESFAVVPVNVEAGDEEKPRAFYRDTGLATLPFFRDETMRVFNDLRAEGQALGLPFTMLVDAAGCARAAMNGAAHWSGEDALALVDVLKASGTAAGRP